MWLPNRTFGDKRVLRSAFRSLRRISGPSLASVAGKAQARSAHEKHMQRSVHLQTLCGGCIPLSPCASYQTLYTHAYLTLCYNA